MELENSRTHRNFQEPDAPMRRLVDANIVGVFIGTLDGRIVEANDAFLAMVGFTREDLTAGRIRWTELTPPEWEAASQAAIEQIGTSGSCDVFEKEYFRKDGSRVPVLVAGTRIGDREAVSFVLDLTERKRVEDVLRESETRFRTLWDQATDAFFLIDEASTVADVNRQACEALGYTREELIGMRPRDFDAGLDDASIARVAERVAAGETVMFETLHRRKDGTVFPVEIRARHFPHGPRRFRLSLVRDITDRKRAEAELRASEERFRTLVQFSFDVYWETDAEHRFIRLEFAERFPDPPAPGSEIGKTPWEVRHFEQDEAAWQKLQATLNAHLPFRDFELARPTPDGGKRYVSASGLPVFDETGRFLGYRGVGREITDHKRAEETLRQSEAYLAEAQRLSHTGSWALDVASGKYLYLSEEFFRIFELDAQEGLPSREDFSRRIQPEDWDRANGSFEKQLREKADLTIEYRIALPSGTAKHIQAIRHPVLNEAGEVVKLVGTVMDMTERKRAEETLRQSEAYLAEAQRLTHSGSWALDVASKTYRYVSEEIFRIFGLDPRQGLPSREAYLRTIVPEDRDRVQASFQESLRQRVDTVIEYRIVLPDGAIRHIHTIRHPVLNEAGDVVEMLGTSIDVTDRKRAEEALRESETRFRAFVDHAADAFFMLDCEQGTIIDVNRPACESLGFTREELLGIDPMAFHLDSDRAQMESVAARAVAGETAIDTHWHRRKDGSLFPVEVHTSAFQYRGRRFLLKVARDITDRLKADEQRDRVRQLEADLAHINRVSVMGELSASIAHELGQPLAGIVSNGGACLRWLGREVPNLEEAREAARRIVRDGKRAGEIIARIRAMVKKTAAPNEKLPLNETIHDVLALVGDEARRRSVLLRRDLAGDLSPVTGDRVQVQQVVLNLVMNAIEAMSGVSERTRELVITTRNLEPDQVQVTVEDSGPGLDPNNIDKIFDSFYSTKPTGFGMGLSICRSILQAHGGRLWATAKDGPGAMFHFTLPTYQGGE
jgi:PAS domain S-box-containing protein